LIIWVARNGDRVANGGNKRPDGATSLKRVAVTAKRLQNLESDVSRTKAHVLRVANAKIDVAHIRAVSSYDAEMVIRHESA
jgi:hypothetical protein